MSPDCGSQGPRFKSRRGTNVLWQDIDLHLLLSTQVLNGYPGRMRKLMWFAISNVVGACKNGDWLECSSREWKMCIHCVTGKHESDDRGNNMCCA